MVCASHTQEMTRSNPSTRSHATQLLRDPNDSFYLDAATVQEWEFFWGSEKGVVPTQKKRKKFLGLFDGRSICYLRKTANRVISLLRESHEAQASTFRSERLTLIAMFQQHMLSPMSCVLVTGERAQGVLMASAFDHPFGAGRMAKETVWYVTPEARGRGAINMLDAYEAQHAPSACISRRDGITCHQRRLKALRAERLQRR